MKRPELKDVKSDIIAYIEYLEEKLTSYEDNSMVDLYKSLSNKVAEISAAIDACEIKLDGDDRVFDRLMKLLEKNRLVVENLTFLEMKLGINQKEEDVSTKNKFKNPAEYLAKNNASKKDKQTNNE